MTFPVDLSRSLAFVPTNVPVVVRHIPFESLRAFCDDRGLHEGDIVSSMVEAVDHLLLETGDGEHVTLEKRFAILIEAERLDRPWGTLA